jgi:predicted NodU family carbamoyl transferase
LWHDAGATIIQNRKICAAINEDKIINVKHASAIPLKV